MTLKQFEATKLPVVEIFSSISGEGISAGTIMTFVRVAGCNLRCSYCDTSYSYDENDKRNLLLDADEIINIIESYKCKNVLCTGGEPLEPDRAKRYLPLYIASKGFKVRIETNGSTPLYSQHEKSEFSGGNGSLRLNYALDVKCPDSGMSSHNIYDENFRQLGRDDEMKFIVGSQTDMKFGLDIINEYSDLLSGAGVVINFSPVFGKLDPADMVGFLKANNAYFEDQNLKVRLSLQIHKFIWPPEARGV